MVSRERGAYARANADPKVRIAQKITKRILWSVTQGPFDPPSPPRTVQRVHDEVTAARDIS
jgi:hypothetical protein